MTIETTDNALPGVSAPTTPDPATAATAASEAVTLPVAGVDPSTPGSLSPGVGEVTPQAVTNVLVNLGIKPDLLGHERLKGINTVEDLANALINAPLAPPVIKPEEYQLPQGVGEDIRGIAHSLSLTQEQLNGLIQFQTQSSQTTNNQQLQQMAEQGQQKLKDWGEKASENLTISKKAVAYVESKNPGLVDLLNNTGYGNHPVVMEMFKTVGEMLKEGGFNKGESYTPAVAKSTADRMFPSQAKENNQ